MNSDSKRAVLQTEKDAGDLGLDSATPGLKTWVTPKVIVATTSEDTASAGSFHNDGKSSAGLS